MQKMKQKQPAVTRELIMALPKVELHRHLEGAFRMETLLELARKRNLVELPLDDVEAFRQVVQMTEKDQPDFLTFLSKFRADWYSTLDDPRRVAYEAVTDAAKENISYFELRFSPEHYARKSDFALEAIIEAVISGASEAAVKSGMTIAYLITLGREKLEADEMIQHIKLCLPYQKHGVVGIDLAGDESHYPPELFTRVFKGLYARTGFHSTIHAGEARGPESVITAITELDAERIGHGVRTIEDEKAMALVLDRKILLEQCLTSNFQTCTVASIKQHPFPKFYKHGIHVTLNADDPQIQQSDLNDDYEHAATLFGFGIEDFRKINLYSLEGAFQPEAVKKKLISGYNARFDAVIAKS